MEGKLYRPKPKMRVDREVVRRLLESKPDLDPSLVIASGHPSMTKNASSLKIA
jgi:hypothetical protein